MTNTSLLSCDGCGQPTTAEHIARRLERLEWATRYRPLHINTLFLGAFSPIRGEEFLYSPGGEFRGEAVPLLEIAGVSASGKSADEAQSEFQRGGHFLTHVLECPLEDSSAALPSLLAHRAPETVARIRRSLKPKRVVPISGALEALIRQTSTVELGCQIILDGHLPFALDGADLGKIIIRLREALAAPAVAR